MSINNIQNDNCHNGLPKHHHVEVAIIIPVHNASDTLEDAVQSAMNQSIPQHLHEKITSSLSSSSSSPSSLSKESILGRDDTSCTLKIFVCCYNDGSTDDSWSILQKLSEKYRNNNDDDKNNDLDEKIQIVDEQNQNGGEKNPKIKKDKDQKITSQLLIQSSQDCFGRGAGYARNRAIEMYQRYHNNQHRQSTDIQNVVQFLCLLDSDDRMHPYRVAEQTIAMLQISSVDKKRHRTILGCTFDRYPVDSTWHYSQWANSLSDERLVLEKFREVTIVQPTWFLCLSRWSELGGYIEAPTSTISKKNDNNGSTSSNSSNPNTDVGEVDQEKLQSVQDAQSSKDIKTTTTTMTTDTDNTDCSNGKLISNTNLFQLIHPIYEKNNEHETSLKLAEDLRFFHQHLYYNGYLALHRTSIPLVTYRHTNTNSSQSYRTSRKLLLQLRVYAFEQSILLNTNHNQNNNNDNDNSSSSSIGDENINIRTIASSPWDAKNGDNGQFVIWGAGRDGKDFVKALSDDTLRQRIYCFVDVDEKKLQSGRYTNKDIGIVDIPIIHYSFLIRNGTLRKKIQDDWHDGTISAKDAIDGRIDKSKPDDGSKDDEQQQAQQQQQQQQQPPSTTTSPPVKKQKTAHKLNIRGLCQTKLQRLPVVVCVAMYRTNGVLERNVKNIGRKEGYDLWHFS